MVGLRLNEAKSELDQLGYQVSGASITLGLGESFPPSIQSSEIWHTHAEYPPRKPCRTEKCPNLWDHSIGPHVSSHRVIYT